jgi:hypothetical protein
MLGAGGAFADTPMGYERTLANNRAIAAARPAPASYAPTPPAAAGFPGLQSTGAPGGAAFGDDPDAAAANRRGVTRRPPTASYVPPQYGDPGGDQSGGMPVGASAF